MIKKSSFIYTIFLLFFASVFYANLTTLQHWDPSPMFSAGDSAVPSASHILDILQAGKKEQETQTKKCTFNINLSGFVQKACSAYDCSGCGEFNSICNPENAQSATEMGDFRGTMYVMGLFLGYDPQGKSIWTNNIDNGVTSNITNNSINATQLPDCLKKAAIQLNGSGASNLAVMSDPAVVDNTFPSIFHSKVLTKDKTFFGAFSTPLEYQKLGFRLSFNATFNEHITLHIQTGVVNIKQKTTGPVSLTGATGDQLFSTLNFNNDGTGKLPTSGTEAQSTFTTQIVSNLNNILSEQCGINYDICSFDKVGLEDFRLLLTFKHTYEVDRYIKSDYENDDFPEMLFTPYLWTGGSFPVGQCIDYTKAYSLPFGNNGHPSIGTGIGFTFDFVNTIEIGFEGGVTYFLSQEETRPFPNHELQRVIYPYSAKVVTEPGLNWHFKALLSSYHFLPGISFFATYEHIEHTCDNYRICQDNTVQLSDGTKKTIFNPEVLECCSDWRSQFINAGLTFELQPNIHASFLWQQGLTPHNAYRPVTFMGTLSFIF